MSRFEGKHYTSSGGWDGDYVVLLMGTGRTGTAKSTDIVLNARTCYYPTDFLRVWSPNGSGVITVQLQPLIEAINDREIVSGMTHDFYRYPARFSPTFARTAIELFTQPGDTVLDPFMGSGTAIVEAFSLGRNAVGVDISQLAVFLTKVKTTILRTKEIEGAVDWARDTAATLSPCKGVTGQSEWADAGYQKNLPWRFRKMAEQAVRKAERLPRRLEPIARCIVLRTLQWAVDCRRQLPTPAEFRERIVANAVLIAEGLKTLRACVSSHVGKQGRIELFNRSAVAIGGDLRSRLLQRSPASLVVTSPPYPGIHVLYHRWQVQSRKETAAPFWIADCSDGQGAAFYTFGDRRRHGQYFDNLLRTFTAIRRVVRKDAYIVQLVGFGKPDEHLPGYLRTMREAGFVELGLREHWRSVPNRKWYSWLRDDYRPAAEILLVHRPAR